MGKLIVIIIFLKIPGTVCSALWVFTAEKRTQFYNFLFTSWSGHNDNDSGYLVQENSEIVKNDRAILEKSSHLA